jgi:putative lipase involved disintegration of autophagic bodies
MRALHPDSHIWMTGFGFCGGLASLLTQAMQQQEQGGKSRVMAITFHAPGDFWFAQRQGLLRNYQLHSNSTLPNHHLPIYNVGISSNPVFIKTVGASIHNYGTLYYQTYMRSGVDCVIPTLGEKRLEYHSIGHLEEAVGMLPEEGELQCHVTGWTEATRECQHYKYVDRDIPSNYLTFMGAP